MLQKCKVVGFGISGTRHFPFRTVVMTVDEARVEAGVVRAWKARYMRVFPAATGYFMAVFVGSNCTKVEQGVFDRTESPTHNRSDGVAVDFSEPDVREEASDA